MSDKTCLWLPCNKITIIDPSAFFGFLTNFMHLINAENMKQMKK